MEGRHVALVTGAGGGIGASISRALARGGASVILAGRDAEKTRAVADEIEQAGGSACCVSMDVTDPDSLSSGIAAGVAALDGPIDWLVNNAGIARSAALLAGGDGFHEEHLAVNYHGPRRLTEALLPAMLERGYGRIVNVASAAGLRGYSYVSAYCASKHALVGYSRAAAHELQESGVKLNVVCPHYVDSPMVDASVRLVCEKTGRSPEDARAFFASQNPGGRFVMPEEVAEQVVSLLTGEHNGLIVELDGGDTVHLHEDPDLQRSTR